MSELKVIKSRTINDCAFLDRLFPFQESNEDLFKKQFSRFVTAGVTSEGVRRNAITRMTGRFMFFFCQMEALYKKAHAAIRADPAKVKKERKEPAKKKRWNRAKLSLAEKKNRVAQKKQATLQKLGKGDE